MSFVGCFYQQLKTIYYYMPFQTINCPSCGAQLELQYRHSRMVVCNYCGQTSYINAGLANPAGEKILLADYGSLLSVGKRGKLKGKLFQVLGRLRFNYEDGFWDEWLIWFDGSEFTDFWLQEDEGEFVLFSKKELKEPAPVFGNVKVGTSIAVNGYMLFITEKNRAVINGGEGELPFQVIPGEKADYMDGISGGKPISIEYMPGEVELNIGEAVALSDFQWN
jgi:ribosomal protein S27E